jgi:hypothetical protein
LQAFANFPKDFLGGFERFQWFASGDLHGSSCFEGTTRDAEDVSLVKQPGQV